MMRRMRTRLPTYLSTGLGALVDISNTPRRRPEDEASRTRSMPQAPVSSNPARRIGKHADTLSNELTGGSVFLIGTLECEVHGQSVNPWIRACQSFHTGNNLQHPDVTK